MARNGDFLRHQPSDEAYLQDEARQLFGQPDVICLNEYLHVYRGQTTETPERRLLAALLRDAIDCYLRDCHAKNRHRKRSYREAEEWFFKSEDKGVFSLENVCATLGLAPGYIRRMLLVYKQQSAVALDKARTESPGERSSAQLSMAS